MNELSRNNKQRSDTFEVEKNDIQEIEVISQNDESLPF